MWKKGDYERKELKLGSKLHIILSSEIGYMIGLALHPVGE